MRSVDLPFALPTAVAGIALTALYAPNGWIGALLEPLGIKVAYTPLGIFVALIFIGLPFVVRTVQPVIEESTARSRRRRRRSAPTRLQTVFRSSCRRLLPALLTGFALALRPRRRRIRLGDLHRRQHALRLARSRRC